MSWVLRLTPDQQEFIDFVIETAAAENPPRTLNKAYALELICLDWLGNRVPDRRLAWLLAQIERVYGPLGLLTPSAPDGGPETG